VKKRPRPGMRLAYRFLLRPKKGTRQGASESSAWHADPDVWQAPETRWDNEKVPAQQLRKDDVVVVSAGELIPTVD
jgi:high-affinity K+ transport system ATPase subunit B